MITRLRRAFGALATEQRRVVLAAALVLVSMLLPWYSKTTNAVTRNGLAQQHEAKMAITVPSFIEASIFLVAVAILVLMAARGERRAFHLPFGDGAVVTAAGGWVAFLVFIRFFSPPSSGTDAQNVTSDFSLSWGIFFGLLAAAFLLYSGLRLRAAHVPEPPLPGGDGEADVRIRRDADIGAESSTAISDREARRQRRAAERAAARAAAGEPSRTPAAPTQRDVAPTPASEGDADAPTRIAPPPGATSVAPKRPPQRPEIDGGEQLSFDEQE